MAIDKLCLVQMLGQLRIVHGPLGTVHFRSAKTSSLLAYLAYYRRNHPREELIDLFWSEAELEKGQSSLRDALRNIGNALKEIGLTREAVLQSDRQTVCLDPEAVSNDVAEFEQYLRQASQVAQAGPRADLLKRAIQLYQSDFMAGFYDDWILSVRDHLKERYVTALVNWGLALEEIGELESALEASQKAILADPSCEEACQLQIRLYACLDRIEEAEQVYVRLEQYLDEYSASPSETTRELIRKIRQEPQSFIQARSPAARPGNLPNRLIRLIGRHREVEECKRGLQTSRLVTLFGEGGIGKTRLALEVAAEASGDFHNGVWFVELGKLNQPVHIMQTVATTLGMCEKPDRSPRQALADHLCSQSVLLILDNCGHLREACAQLAADLISDCPYLRILATSREVLGLTGEIQQRVPPLTLPGSNAESPSALMSQRL